jgi:ABC-type multidrug transport system fused ATPase/permease subunit
LHNQATGSRIGTAAQTIATLVIGLALSLYFSWKLGLVTTAFVPVVFLSVYLEGRVMRIQNVLTKNSLENASKVIALILDNFCRFHDSVILDCDRGNRQYQNSRWSGEGESSFGAVF